MAKGAWLGAASLCVLLGSALHESTALAYCRAGVDTTTDPCVETAEPRLFWARSCVAYAFHEATFQRMPLLSEQQVRTIVDASFGTWADVDCGMEPFSVQQLAGTTTADPIAFVYDRPNEFVISALTAQEWRDLGESSRIFAITFLWHHPETGRIYDVDMALNLGIGDFGVCDLPCQDGTIDLQNTVTHEAGHVLGLGHSGVRAATMFPDATAGANFMRDLSTDDEVGTCALDLPPHACQGPADCVCGTPPVLSSGQTRNSSCAATPVPTRERGFLSAWLLAPALLYVRRRRRA